MKAETIWFKLCLGESPQLDCGIEEESEPELENEKEDQKEDGIDLATKKEQLLMEFISPSNQQELPIQYPVGVIPGTSLMLQFDQVLTQRLIGYHVQWLLKRISVIQSLYHLLYR